MKKIITFLLFLLAANTYAATHTANFTTSAQLQQSCTVSMDNVSFEVTEYGVNKQFTINLHVICTKGTHAVALISEGQSGDANARYMTDGTPTSNNLYYNLFNPEDMSPLGQDGNGINVIGDGALNNHQVYAIMNMGQYVKVGNYSDSLTVKLTY